MKDAESELRQDQRDGRWYPKSAYLKYYGRSDGARRWARAIRGTAAESQRTDPRRLGNAPPQDRQQPKGQPVAGLSSPRTRGMPCAASSSSSSSSSSSRKAGGRQRGARGSQRAAVAEKEFYAVCRRAVLGIIRKRFADLEEQQGAAVGQAELGDGRSGQAHGRVEEKSARSTDSEGTDVVNSGGESLTPRTSFVIGRAELSDIFCRQYPALVKPKVGGVWLKQGVCLHAAGLIV